MERYLRGVTSRVRWGKAGNREKSKVFGKSRKFGKMQVLEMESIL